MAHTVAALGLGGPESGLGGGGGGGGPMELIMTPRASKLSGKLICLLAFSLRIARKV